jgi:hypothetical protein
VLLLLVDWTLSNADDPSSATLRLLLYFAFVLPLIGPQSRWTHLQLSVPAFAVLLWVLSRRFATPSHQLASSESGVV